jgi:catechol 2,3-dioxygenase-like lactoylglutathione lyase family enzyme
MPKLTRIQHEGIPVHDLGKSQAFYEQVIGLQLLPRPPLGPGVWLGDASGVPQMHLIVNEDWPVPGPGAKPNARSRHTAFLVDDYEGLKRRFQELDITWSEVPDSVVGLPQLFCVDPDGHTLEFQPAERYGGEVFTPGYKPNGA